MLRGERVALRGQEEADRPVLDAELYDDVETRSRADPRPWRPRTPDATPKPRPDDAALFSVVSLEDDELAGEAILWGVDSHNRSGHLGISLRPGFRGRGLSGEVVSLLCRYGFTVRGLRRLQIETLADNTAMLAVAERAGFVREGVLRQKAWVLGAFVDEVVLGLLAAEWAEERGPQPRAATE